MNATPSADHRRHRTQAARLLAMSPRRRDIAWRDLALVPDWALGERTAVNRLAVAAGVRAHAAALRRCIDGRVLKHLCAQLGEPAMDALIGHDDADAATGMETLDPIEHDIDARLLATGRDWLLASVESPVLRESLRELLWPDAGPGLRALNAKSAARVVEAARAALELKEIAA
ncbi:hypothetical protein [Piscinibacter terrae]|uniref:Uncharacterized protein n=1 Tax=Piscinibacter terrae TaxID=2496871 RepID=A0A3N7JQD7_9BURK|nr:hypothetical protein [Albitalea terrae]RQP21265.1 hypothetical protein DZC73_28940 [Albitalea terrae]